MKELMGEISPKPVIKWAGGKSSLIPIFQNFGLLPKRFNHYYEPFLGGASIFLFLKQQKKDKLNATLSDINRELIDMYLVIRDNPSNLIDELITMQSMTSRNEYYDFRSEFNKLINTTVSNKVRKSALFIYLNKTCYNGLFRVNKKGEFNVPYCGINRKKIFDANNILNYSRYLSNVEIMCCDYRQSCKSAIKGDFIYFDPPYMPFSDTEGFTDYSQNGFDKKEQMLLSEIFEDLSSRGVKILLSNSYHEEIKKLYSNKYKVHINTVDAQRYISCKSDGRKVVKEYVITNFKPKNTL
jgi:DNA adenine methylase